MLVGAMNRCPCGYYGDPVKECTCSAMMISRYRKRISGPLLDRIDIYIEVPRVEYDPVVAPFASRPFAARRRRDEGANHRRWRDRRQADRRAAE
jgi:magnesium chelatase family protein